MKTNLFRILIALAIFSSPTLKAQNILDDISMVLITGPGVSWISSDDNTINSQGFRISYKIHAMADYALNERFSLTGGLGLSLAMGGKMKYQKGGDLWSESRLNVTRGDSLPDGVELGYFVNYIDFPIGFRMRTNQFGKFRFFAHMPELSLGIRTRAKGSIEGQGISTSGEQIKNQVGFLNFSWGIGAGTEYYFSEKLTLTGGIRFFQSLTDITDDSGRFRDGTKENSKGVIHNLDLRFGIIF
jgi:opacity protein-like surface antigen